MTSGQVASNTLNPRDAETHFGLAEAYRRKGLLADCESELREALRIDPSHPEARLALGVTHLHQERWNDAAAEFQRLVDDPTFIRPARALVNLGWAHYKSGDLDQAKKDFERALTVDRQNYTAHLDLGIVLYEQDHLVEAIQHFEECVKVVSDRPALAYGAAEAEARFRMAQAYVRLDQRGRAVEALKVAVQRVLDEVACPVDEPAAGKVERVAEDAGERAFRFFQHVAERRALVGRDFAQRVARQPLRHAEGGQADALGGFGGGMQAPVRGERAPAEPAGDADKAGRHDSDRHASLTARGPPHGCAGRREVAL